MKIEINAENYLSVNKVNKVNTIMGYIPEINKRLEEILIDYRIKKLVIKNRPSSSEFSIAIHCYSEGGEEYIIKQDNEIDFVCYQRPVRKILNDNTKRLKYLEGEYIFKDIPWTDFGEFIEITFD